MKNVIELTKITISYHKNLIELLKQFREDGTGGWAGTSAGDGNAGSFTGSAFGVGVSSGVGGVGVSTGIESSFSGSLDQQRASANGNAFLFGF